MAPDGRVHTFGSVDPDSLAGVERDDDGNLYITGSFRNLADFGCGSAIPSRGGEDAYVAKLSSDGSCLWLRTIGGLSDESGRRITLSPDGEVLAAGRFMATALFDEATVEERTAVLARDVYVTAYSPAGDHLWTRSIPGMSGSDDWSIVGDIVTRSDGEIVFTGAFSGSADFGWDGISDPQADNGYSDAYVTRMGSDGSYIDTFTFGGAGSDYANALAVDASDALHVGGALRGSDDVDPGEGTHTLGGNHDGYVVKYEPDFSAVSWAITSGLNSWSPYHGLAFSPAGDRVYGVRHSYAADQAYLQIQSIATDTGIVEWMADMVGGDAVPRTLKTDAEGAIYTCGWFRDTVDFDPGPGEFLLTSAGENDGFFLRLLPDESLGEALRLGGNGVDAIDDFVVLGPNEYLLVGGFSDVVDLSSIGIDYTIESAGASDVFLLHVGP